MNYVEQAIRDAKEKGGYKEIWFYGREDNPSWVLLDPDFWRALGKAKGWDSVDPNDCGGCDTCYQHFGAGPHKDEWKEIWHRFIDHLAAEKPIEDFFKELV